MVDSLFHFVPLSVREPWSDYTGEPQQLHVGRVRARVCVSHHNT